jgi:hypothetical protein
VKGRDFYDHLWYLGRKTPVHLKHLKACLRQSGHQDAELELWSREYFLKTVDAVITT